MANYTGYIVAIPGVVEGDLTRSGAVWPVSDIIYGRPNRDVGAAAITLGAATLSSSGTVASTAITGQLAVTLGALVVASTGTVKEFEPSRERTTRVPSWPRILLAENPDRVIELYRPPRTVRTAA